ncbi:aldehyde dehydrogenase family protein [Saxibacter everestensis]|uniref:aldehyde dehydrogenase (NAD(+)) n=1 Tax=Saxibacter everestensis TaxID=2909229 RepID=A0ABY8QTR1_9MICO|nr:aldehyde dehydrogenase family protein [Brevibacteriaceae bacterium ZFBP1038]
MTEILSDHLLNYIDGAWKASQSARVFRDVNPADVHDVIGEFADSTRDDAVAAVEAAVAGQPGWDRIGPVARGDVLFDVAEVFASRIEEFAVAVSREQGKSLNEARGEAKRALDILRFTAGEGRRLNGSTLPAEQSRVIAMTWRKPIGVVGLITPWNFPLAIPMWKVAPALLSGCAAVLKPSPLTPWTSALLAQAFIDGGVPGGVLNLVQGDREAGEAIVAHPEVRGISFTGSLPVGLAIQQAVAPRLARTQLELGGKNAAIVLADADLDLAADAIVHGAFGQAGQRCSATSRVVVDRSVREDLIERLIQRAGQLRVGRPDDARTGLGPVVNQERLDACLQAIDQAAADGGRIRVGGHRVQDGLPDGYYVAATVISDVAADSELAQEEVFGPVLAVIDADGFDDAMRISNSVKYGMSGTIFTENRAHVFDALDRFEAGMLHVNRPGVGAWPHMPHMGAKLSQYGAPECSPEVWEFYLEWRSACIAFPEQ